MNEYGFIPERCKEEIKDLSGILYEDEKIYGLFEAQLRNVHTDFSFRYGLAIATNRRILCYRKSFIGTVTSEELPLSKITGVSYRKGIWFGSVAVTSANNESVFEYCFKKDDAEKFAKVVKKLLDEVNVSIQTAPQPSIEDENLVKLEKLFQLKERDILTEDEFIQQKIKLLS